MDYVQMITDSFHALNDRSNWKYVLIIAFVYIINFVLNFGIRLLGFPPNPTTAIPAQSGLIIAGVLVTFVLSVIVGLVLAYILVLVMLKALGDFGLGAAAFSIRKFIKLIVLWIAQEIVSIFCIFNPIFLVLPGLIILLSIVMVFVNIGIVKLIAMALAFICILLYSVVVLYNGIRLFLSTPAFLSKDIGVIASLKESWELTKGKVLSLIVAVVLISIVFIALTIAIMILLLIPIVIITIILGIIAGVLNLQILVVLVALLLFFLSMLVMFLYIGAIFVVDTFYRVAIYRFLLGKSPAPQQAVKAALAAQKQQQAEVPRRESVRQRAEQRQDPAAPSLPRREAARKRGEQRKQTSL